MRCTDKSPVGDSPDVARYTFTAARAFLVDWDGTLFIGDAPVPGALGFLHRFGSCCTIISNNSTELPEDIRDCLRSHGVTLSPEQILLAGQRTIQAVRNEFDGKRVLMFAAPKLCSYAEEIDLHLVDENPDVLILLRDTAFSYDKLAQAVNLLRSGVPLIVSNPDLAHPGANGGLIPETGALLAAIREGLGHDPINCQVFGKPSPGLFNQALAQHRVDPLNVVVIGDNFDTDGRGAQAAGLQFIHFGRESDVTWAGLMEGMD